MRYSIFALVLPAFLATVGIGCGSSVAPPLALQALAAEASTSSDLYVDIESQAQLGGIPFFVNFYNGFYKVSVVTFAEDPGPPKTFDKRLAFKGVKDPDGNYVAGWVGIARAFTGETEFRTTLAVKSDPGVQSGYGGGYIIMNFPPNLTKTDDSPEHTYLGASYSSGIGGFVMQAWDSNIPVGSPLPIPNTSQVDLRMTRVGGSIVMSARPTPETPGDEGGWLEVFTVSDPLPTEACSLEFGAEGLDSGGQVFFDYFYVGGPTVGGVVETPPMEEMSQALYECDSAQAFVGAEVPDFTSATAKLASALTSVTAAQAAIDSGIEKDAFQVGTRAKLARTAAKRGRIALDKAHDLCEQGSATKTKLIQKLITAGRGHCVVTIANLAGVKTATPKKLPIAD